MVLEKFKHLEFRSARTPIDLNHHLMKNKGESTSQLEYARVLGSLMYIMNCTRPDIACAISKLSRFTSNPNKHHWVAMKRVLGYLEYTQDCALHYNNYPAYLGSLPNRHVSLALLQPHQLVNKELTIDDLETNHFVLVHGGGFGAWCWYKTIALLEEAGFKVTAVDLTGSGIHSFDTNSITSLSQYAKPLTDFLETLADGKKVILVGHDFGGACISFAMELYPSKVSKAIFVAATMLISGQSALDIFSDKTNSNDLMRQSQVFIYANGNDKPPTAIDLDKSLLRDLLFNHSPAKDVALASVSMRPIPFSPVLEKLPLSNIKYGSIRRFYVETTEDNAIPIALQQSMINQNPPERVFQLKGADHSPFFSKPQALHKILVEISRIPPI
uniref:Methylesterase 11, chloroplastic n=1 Tax=Nicotiana sylvestris TaxID=4096 RepID=A0A1U7X5I1_NICSY|nr:PREDICTED: putative methylesterase 11, chloroplastic [Nicotiana sylvestris]